MFGFSLQKLLVLVAIVVAIWFGFKLIGHLDYKRKQEARLRRRGGARSGAANRGRSPPEAEDMIQCPSCRAYVSARQVSNCGRGDCPY
jgi:uncharacterized protein